MNSKTKKTKKRKKKKDSVESCKDLLENAITDSFQWKLLSFSHFLDFLATENYRNITVRFYSVGNNQLMDHLLNIFLCILLIYVKSLKMAKNYWELSFLVFFSFCSEFLELRIKYYYPTFFSVRNIMGKIITWKFYSLFMFLKLAWRSPPKKKWLKKTANCHF